MKTAVFIALIAFAGLAQTVSSIFLSNIPCSRPVKYTVVQSCTWNSRLHPTDYPSNAHWSPLCGTAHRYDVSIFKLGQPSSDGVKLVAETGSCDDLKLEVDACTAAGKCNGLHKFPCNPFSGTCTSTGSIAVSKYMKHVSFVSMVAPSPDWFTGVSGISLCVNGWWVRKYANVLGAYDAGTDAGTTFASPNAPEPVRLPITRFSARDASNIFYSQQKHKLFPLCKIKLILTG